MRKAPVALLACMTLSSCAAVSPAYRPLRPLAIATMPYEWNSTAAVTGSLLYEGGCLLFHDDLGGRLYVPVWPMGSGFNGEAVTMHIPGKINQAVQIAQEVTVSGRELTAPYPASLSQFEQQCDEPPLAIVAVRPAD